MTRQGSAPANTTSLLLGRGLLLSLPAMALLMTPWLPVGGIAPIVSTWFAALLLLIYPGYLLLRLLAPQWRLGRAKPAVAAVLGYGLWTPPAVMLIIAGGSVGTLITGAVVMEVVLAWLIAWRERDRPLHGHSLYALRHKGWAWLRNRDWLAELLFWGALAVALGLLLLFAGVERHSDRQTYQAQIRYYADAPALGVAGYLSYSDIGLRLQVASWLVQVAALVRAAGIDTGLLYSFALPPLLLALSLSAAWGLGRRITRSARGAGLMTALLVLHWVSTIALPQTEGYGWLERVQIRPEGAFATLGYWALTSHILEDKFILTLLMLPVALLLLLYYLEDAPTERSKQRLPIAWQRLTLLAIVLTGVAFVHQLGPAFLGLTAAALGAIHFLRRPSQTVLIKLAAAGVLLLAAMGPAFSQREAVLESAAPILRAPSATSDFVNSGPAEVGLWVWTENPQFFAVDTYVLWRQPLVVLALVLLPVLVVWRRLRSLGDQLLAAMLLLVLLVTYNPLVAPVLSSVITYRMLFRTTWLIELPAILLLARMAILGFAWLRLRSPAWKARQGLLEPLLVLGSLLLAISLLAPRTAAGITLLKDVQHASLTPAEADVLAFLRDLGREKSDEPARQLVWAPPNLIDELPAATGNAFGPYFRYRSINPIYYATIRDFYAPGATPERLDLLAEQPTERVPELILAEVGSALDMQLGELADSFAVAYRNTEMVVYAPTEQALQQEPFSALTAASQMYRAGNPGQAEVMARTILAQQPGNLTAQVQLMRALLAQQHTEEALEVAEQAAHRAPASEWAQMLLSEAQRRLAALAVEQGDPDGARAAYRAALAVDPTDIVSASELAKHVGWNVQGELVEADRMLAIARLQAAAEPKPERPTSERSQAYLNLGAAYEQIGDTAQAETAFKAGIDTTRLWDANARGKATAELGRFYVRTGNLGAAQQLYQQQVQRYPAAAAIYTAWAELAQLQAGKEAARVIYEAAHAVNPQASWPSVAQARLIWQDTSGTAEEEAGQAAAKEALQRALAADSGDREAYKLLAAIAAARDDRAAAQDVWRQAVLANPGAVWPLTALAETARSNWDFPVAQPALEQANKLAPDDEQIAADLAEVKRAAANQYKVQKYWEQHADRNSSATFVPVHQPFNGWTLVGYIADLAALYSGAATPVWWFWEAPDHAVSAGSTGAGWEQISETVWVQMASEVRNQIPDGGMEHSGKVGKVLGFPGDLYEADPSTRQVRRAVRGGKETFAAVLANGLGNPDTSYVSQPIAVTAGTVYLQSGAVRSVGGNAFLGRRWRQADGTAVEEYLVAGEAGGVWREAVQVAVPPDGATALEVLLLNRSTTGAAYFDDLLLLPFAWPPDAAE